MEIPEGSGLEKYLKDFESKGNIKDFIKPVFEEIMLFLKKKLLITFHDIILTKCYRSKDFDRICLEEGITGEYPLAIIIHSRSFSIPDRIAVDLQRMGTYAKSIVFNFILVVMEELIHSACPLKTELEVGAIMFPLAEEFMGIKLSDDFKKMSENMRT